jgi:hypothetical protein
MVLKFLKNYVRSGDNTKVVMVTGVKEETTIQEVRTFGRCRFYSQAVDS